MLCWLRSWIFSPFYNYNKPHFPLVLYGNRFLYKNEASSFHIENAVLFFENGGIIWYCTFLPQEYCRTWLLRACKALLLLFEVTYHVYAEIVTATVWRTVLHYTIFRMLQNIQLNMHPRLCLLGASKACTWCWIEVHKCCRVDSCWEASELCFFVERSTSRQIIKHLLTRNWFSPWTYDINIF